MGVADKIATMSPPAQREIQALLGLVGFWRMHIPGYCGLVSPTLYRVIQKKKYFEWGLEKQAVEQTKKKRAPVVALAPVWTESVVQNILSTAAGKCGVTWSLWQRTSGKI